MMALLQHLRVDDVVPQPWKNGGGQTRELLAWPGPSDWWLRISVADIESDGPFSAYPGIDRWFGVLSGEGVELAWQHQAVRRMHAGHSLLHFDGGSPPECRLLHGSTRDLNVMHRRGLGRVMVRRAHPDSRPPAGHARFALFTVEPIVVHRPERADLRTAAWTLVWGEGSDCTVDVVPDGHAWWVGFDEHAS